MKDLAIIEEIKALGVHYLRPVRSPEQEERFYEDYIEDLKAYPLEAIKAGCAKWRRSGANKFPTPGQLVPLVRASLPSTERPADNRPWVELSNTEYESLSLRDKVRHQKILGYRANERAGPMWRSGRPCPAEDMPARWHDLRAKASGHFAEAQRLQGLLDGARTKAEA